MPDISFRIIFTGCSNLTFLERQTMKRGRNARRRARAYPAFYFGANMNSLLDLNNKIFGV